jgi:glycosyltransferase involved in cell wall biosynthesis
MADGVTGFLVDKRDPEEIADKILRLANDNDLRVDLGTAARDFARRRFDSRQNALVVQEIILASL